MHKSILALASSLWHYLEPKDKFSLSDDFKLGNTTIIRQVIVGAEGGGGGTRRESRQLS